MQFSLPLFFLSAAFFCPSHFSLRPFLPSQLLSLPSWQALTPVQVSFLFSLAHSSFLLSIAMHITTFFSIEINSAKSIFILLSQQAPPVWAFTNHRLLTGQLPRDIFLPEDHRVLPPGYTPPLSRRHHPPLPFISARH